MPGSNSNLRVVFDSSVLIAAFFSAGLAFEAVTVAADRNILGVASLSILEEVRTRLVRSHGEPLTALYLSKIERFLILVQPLSLRAVPGLRDEFDLHILGTAVAGRANLIVSYDKDLLALREYEGIGILHPRALLYVLAER